MIRRMGDFAFRLETLTVIDYRLAVDFAGKKALIDEEPVSLTPTETKILHILIRSARRTVTTEYLLARLWRNLAQTVQHEFRLEAYQHIQALDMAWFADRSRGGLMSVLESTSELIATGDRELVC